MPRAGTAGSSGVLSPDAREIVRLNDAGYSDEFLLAKIRRDDVAYQLTVDDLVALRRAGLSEDVVNAMLASGAGAKVPQRVEFDALVLQTHGFLGIGSSRTKHTGTLVIDHDNVIWKPLAGPRGGFELYAKSVREIWLNCAQRESGSLCLEFCLQTYSGDERCFRDIRWENGDDQQVLALFDHFRRAYPGLLFSKREKKSF
jgi:hypothetical protein